MNKTAERGVDVRILFWRNTAFFNPNQFTGSRKEISLLHSSYPLVKIRWDDSGPDHAHCHHEKSWFIDCGQVIPKYAF